MVALDRQRQREREAGAYKQFVYLRTTRVKTARSMSTNCVVGSLRKWSRLK
jgi:hypothetical protein